MRHDAIGLLSALLVLAATAAPSLLHPVRSELPHLRQAYTLGVSAAPVAPADDAFAPCEPLARTCIDSGELTGSHCEHPQVGVDVRCKALDAP